MEAAPDADWLDKMVTKLIEVLEQQLTTVADAKATASSPATRAADARTLASLERTLERLSRLERERAVAREKKRTDEADPRAALERRLDQRLAALPKKSAARKPG